ncbi:DUF2326 domain-containing protein [Acinetobacter terrestris]|uniref:DUF2326 domain-containing protein n=1 Tax=Acinetobacter terrestris TaxID=2529843 RepID=A0ABX1UXH7_9GAMM|nr:DUF2326 domain-containing protein [Acinetobacter terrestris]NNH27067.1 DUF2326 domain-containing protein [Acinetobacter terrestris]
MQILKLVISQNNKIIREIPFKKGLNLVINKSEVTSKTGNGVGKTTLSKVIDCLFLGNIEQLYKDYEFNTDNLEISEFLNNNEILATLFYINQNQKPQSISRILKNDKDSYFINSVQITKTNYEKFIKLEFFSITSKKPTVRSIISKFIRNDSHKMLNTINFQNSYTNDSLFSEIFLYLLGFSNTQLLSDKKDASNLLNKRNKNLTSIKYLVKEQDPKSNLTNLYAQSKKIEDQIVTFSYDQDSPSPLQELTELQVKENTYNTDILHTQRKIENIEKTIKILNEHPKNQLLGELNEVYQYAGITLENALRDLSDVIDFHNNLLDKKQKYIGKELPLLKSRLLILSDGINQIQSTKNTLMAELTSNENLELLSKKIKELSQIRTEIGKLEGLIEQQVKAVNDKNQAEIQLQKLSIEVAQNFNTVESFIKKLNFEFSNNYYYLYHEKINLDHEYDKQKGILKILINNNANPEGGKKKAEVISFDQAYITTLKNLNIHRPNFIFHDSIEDIDKNQIKKIFELAEKLDGFEVISMLADKIDSDTLIKYKDCIILELSEDDKFFKI